MRFGYGRAMEFERRNCCSWPLGPPAALAAMMLLMPTSEILLAVLPRTAELRSTAPKEWRFDKVLFQPCLASGLGGHRRKQHDAAATLARPIGKYQRQASGPGQPRRCLLIRGWWHCVSPMCASRVWSTLSRYAYDGAAVMDVTYSARGADAQRRGRQYCLSTTAMSSTGPME
jgi:hypothetical protein